MNYASPHNLKTPATNNSDKLIIELSRLYMHGENIRIKKAELIIHQHSIDSFPEHHYPILKVFKTTEDYICGDITLRNEDLLDCQLTKADADFYSFNITPFIREFNQSYDYYNYLAIQMEPIGLTTGSVKLYGTTASTNFVPKLKITYDKEYNVDAEPLAHKHSLGRLGEATIDLVRGNMLIETTDIIGEGNKMPLTISCQGRNNFRAATLLHGSPRALCGVPAHSRTLTVSPRRAILVSFPARPQRSI
jgi:hypothetical protein